MSGRNHDDALPDALREAVSDALALIGRSAQDADAPTLARITGRDLYAAEYPPRQFLVDGLIKRGDLVVLAGRPKSGKSWLTLQLAQALDTGAPFLGRAVTRARVLFIALEDGARRIHERLHIRRWLPNEAEFAFALAPLGGGLGMRQLRVAADDFDVICVDSLRAACGDADENDNAVMGAIVQALADIAHQTQTAILTVHHTRKGGSDDPFDTVRGAGAIRAAYDVGLLFERKVGEAEALLRVESRDVQADDMTLRWDASGWSYEGDGGRIEELRAGRRALQALRELGDGQTTDDVAKHLNVARSSALRQLQNLEREGRVRRETEMTGTKPRDVWYLA